MTAPAPVNVAEHLARQAAARPDAAALYVPHRGGHRTITFAELDARATAFARGLNSLGLTQGTRTVLMVPPSEDFFALTFALLRLAAVPVLIDPGMGVKNLGPCLATAEPEAFIGIAKAHVARRLFGWGKDTVRTTVNVGRWRFFCNESTERIRRDRPSPLTPYPDSEESWRQSRSRILQGEGGTQPEDQAAILFTSGSTGPAKGVEYTHGIFAAQVEMLKSTYGIEPGEVDYCSFPLFALFGPALGMSCVIPAMDASRPATIDPAKAVADVAKFKVTNLFGSPAVIRRLAEYGKPLPTLRRAISAGAPAAMPVVEAFAKLLPAGVELCTPYGATESLPVANVGSRELLEETRRLTEQGHGVCIGRTVKGMRVDVIRISDDAIESWDDSLLVPDGEVGEFVVRGPVVTKRYTNNPAATRMAKIHDPATGETLHRMGDVGYRDDRGRLWFCGRKGHRVVTPNGTLFTDMVEPIFNSGIGRTALVGVCREGIVHPILCVEILAKVSIPNYQKELLDRAQSFPHTKSIRTILAYPMFKGFPVDVRHNSKIFREKLATWADRRLGNNWLPPKAHGRPSVGTGATI
jgi:acyl-CoA synthetase (AMP-forming)/AMP-acid ligase II